LAFTAAFSVQVIILFVLLASLGITRVSSRDVLARLLVVLPIEKRQRWIALLLPSFILVGIAVALAGWPLGRLLVLAGLDPLLFVFSGTIGVFAALGAMYGIPRKYAWVQVIGIPSLILGEYSLARTVNESPAAEIKQAAASFLFVFLLGSLSWLFFRSSRHVAADISLNTYGKNAAGTSLPVPLWFIKKVARAKTTQLGFITSVGMSLAAAVFFKRQAMDPYMFALVASIIAATFTSDMRSLSRHTRPAEITTLRATARFMTTYAISAVLCGLAAVSPLLLTGISLSGAEGLAIIGTVVQVLFGISAGIFAGSLLVPMHRDVMGQILAALLCMCILMGIPYLPLANRLDTLGVCLFEAGLIAILLTAASAIEYQRNRYIWRKS
jgi:hypothetical protein